jgi:hypothetical protein
MSQNPAGKVQEEPKDAIVEVEFQERNILDVDTDHTDDLREVLDPGVLKTLYAILGNPTATASIKEVRTLTDESYTTVRDRLERLSDREPPFINKLPVPEKDQENNMPKNFYAVTEHAAELLRELGRYDEIEVMRAAYLAWDRPEEIRAVEDFNGRPEI